MRPHSHSNLERRVRRRPPETGRQTHWSFMHPKGRMPVDRTDETEEEEEDME